VGKTALIVDDSKSARMVLKKVLETHDLVVDTAESAEDALVYLNDHRPDVIFMDHLMPGMDGFEAVTAIKNNPDTATIPIMMYTSQEGEVYVGQARALGAVGVLPKQIEPVEVSKILESLRVISRSDPAVAGDDTHSGDTSLPETTPSGEYRALETLDADLRILISDLFDQQRAVIRRDLLDSYEAIARRVADEIRPREEEPPPEEFTIAEPESSPLLPIAAAVLAVLATVFAWLFWEREQSYSEVVNQRTVLQRALDVQRSSVAVDALANRRQLEGFEDSVAGLYAATLDGLEWGANLAAEYDYDEAPLGDDRLAIVRQLAEKLQAVDFEGLVRIETHVGDFCMRSNANGEQVPAGGDVIVAECERVGMAPGNAYESGARQSVAFANFVRLANEQLAGKIRYEVVSVGNSEPLVQYPVNTSGMLASEWNALAARNNRVEITIYAGL